MDISEQLSRVRDEAVAEVATMAGRRGGEACRRALARLWEDAFQEGRLAALDEFQDRFCVCMKS